MHERTATDNDEHTNEIAERVHNEYQHERSRYLKPKNQKQPDPTPLRSAETAPASHRSADRIPDMPAVRGLYAIVDSVTDQIIGGIQIHLNTQSAVRTIIDILRQPNSTLANHPLDFDLYRLGTLDNAHRVHPNWELILAGTQIKTMIAEMRGPDHA